MLLNMGRSRPREVLVLRRLLQGRCNTRRLRWIDPTGLLQGIAQPDGCVSSLDEHGWGAELLKQTEHTS